MRRKTMNLFSAAIIAAGGLYLSAAPALAATCSGPAGSGGCTCTSGDGAYTCTGDSCSSSGTSCSSADKKEVVAPTAN